MVYWFEGQPQSGKTILAKKLHNFLKTEKRNWRKDVFHLDETDLRELGVDKEDTTRSAQMMTEYLHNNGCDVVVSLSSPFQEVNQYFTDKIGGSNFQEFYICNTELNNDEKLNMQSIIIVDTTNDSPNISFSKILHQLETDGKL